MTKKETFATIKTLLADNDEIVAFCNHEIEMLENRKGTSNSKAKAETAARAEKAFAALAEMEEPVTITDFQKLTSDEAVAGWSNQRLARLLNTLVAEGRVAKEMRKKRAYFSVA